MLNKKTLQDKHSQSYVDSPTRENKTAQEVLISNKTIGLSPFGEYDTIAATYPTTSSELYTYSFSGTAIGTILVSYTDSTKEVLNSVVKNEL